MLPAPQRAVMRQRRAARRQQASEEEAKAARAAVLAEKAVAAQAVFVERCRAGWRRDPEYGKRRRGLPTPSGMEHTYAQVDRCGYAAEQLVRWQERRMARGLAVVEAARPPRGRKRRLGGEDTRGAERGAGRVPAAGAVAAAGMEQQDEAPVEGMGAAAAASATPTGARPAGGGLESPRTRMRAAAYVRAARARRSVEHAAQRSIAFGALAPARAGARLPPASSGRMAGRPVRGWVRDPMAEGRGSRDRGSTHLSELAPIPKRPRR